MAIILENELYLPIKEFFEEDGWVVKGEVQGCDMLAYSADHTESLIIELKKTLNISLLFQSMKRQKLSPNVYAAVEYADRGKRASFTWSEAAQLCRKLGIGLITVQFFKRRKPDVIIHCHPKPFSYSVTPAQMKKQNRLQQEFAERSGDFNLGGSRGTKLVTAYREKALHCAFILSIQGPLSVKELRYFTENEKIGLLLRRNVYGWFERVQRGIYQLTDQGHKGLHKYEKVVQLKQKNWNPKLQHD